MAETTYMFQQERHFISCYREIYFHSMEYGGLLNLHAIKEYIPSSMIFLTEPIFIESCQLNYVTRGKNVFSVSIKVMNNMQKIAILSHIYA